MNYEHFSHGKQNIFLVDMTKEIDHYFSELVKGGIAKYLKEGKKIGIIVNKRGFSNGVICYSCGHIPHCQKCSVSISYHKQLNGEMMGLCHICKTQYILPKICEKCGSQKIKPYGIGTQQVFEWVKNEYGVESLIIDSSTVGSKKKVLDSRSKILGSVGQADFSSNFFTQDEGKVIIGTSLLAQPILDYPLDLVIFLNADQGLNVPDYTASENNFLLLYEAFSKHKTSQFVVQSMKVDQNSIRYACKMDKEGFWACELQFRKQYNYPPHSELCLIIYRNEIESRLFKKVDTLYQELLYLKQRYQMNDLEIYSTPPMIYKMFGKYRYHIILKGDGLRNFMDIAYTKLDLYAKGFKIDWMAGSIV